MGGTTATHHLSTSDYWGVAQCLFLFWFNKVNYFSLWYLKPNILICVTFELPHVSISYLINSHHSCSQVKEQHKHFQHNPPLSSLFVCKPILHPGERSLHCEHSPLFNLPCRCWLSFFLKVNFPQWTHWFFWTQMILARFVQKRPLHASKCRVNAALPTHCTMNVLQFVIYLTELHNLTVMNTSGNIKKCNWNCSIGTKAKHRSYIVVMRPPIVEPLLNHWIYGRLEILL